MDWGSLAIGAAIFGVVMTLLVLLVLAVIALRSLNMATTLTPAEILQEVTVHTDAIGQGLQHLPPSEDRETALKRNETVRGLTKRIVDEGVSS